MGISVPSIMAAVATSVLLNLETEWSVPVQHITHYHRLTIKAAKVSLSELLLVFIVEVPWDPSSKEFAVLFAFQVSFAYLLECSELFFLRHKDTLCQKNVCPFYFLCV